MDPNEIQKIFGAPMNTSVTPNQPFQLNFLHLVIAGVIGYFLLKGVEKVIEEKAAYKQKTRK